MDIVIDASAIIAVLVNETEKPALLHVTQGARLLAPPSVPWEIGNAFSAMLKRHRITIDQAIQAIEAYVAIPIRLMDVELVEAMRLADQLNLYAYDAYLLLCAARYHAPLLSLDRNLIVAAIQLGLDVIEV